MSIVNSILRFRALRWGTTGLEFCGHAVPPESIDSFFCSAFNRCEPFQAEEQFGLRAPFASFSMRMTVNFTAYFKETDQSSHLMQ